MDRNKQLENMELFKNIRKSDIHSILSHHGWHSKTYDEGESIHYPHEKLESLIILVSGGVEGIVITESGRRLTLNRRKGPELLGLAMIFSDKKTLMNIKAFEKSQVLKLNRNNFMELMKRYPLLLDNFLRICANRFNYLSSRLEILSLHTIKKKIAHYLLELHSIHGCSFRLDRTISALAAYMGVERPSLSTAFHDMKKKGYFVYSNGMVNISDISKLETELESD